MPEITVNRDELDRPIWKEVGAYKKTAHKDGTYTIFYSADVDPSKLVYKPTRQTYAERKADDADSDAS